MTELYVFLAVLAAIVVAGYVLQLSWTGLRPAKNDDNSGTKTKTLWDWLALLIVPFVLGSGAYGINSAQADREKKREIAREKQQDAIAEDARRAGALDSYLKQMSSLITDKGLSKTKSSDEDEDGIADAPIAALAQSLTLTVLRGLDGARKGEIAQFLARSGLIPRHETGVINLRNADLRGARLVDSDLSNAWFEGADLRGADFRNAEIDGAYFGWADLRDADFSNSYYWRAEKDGKSPVAHRVDFSDSCLSGAKFSEADLPRASFEKAQARSIDLTDAWLTSVIFTDAKLMNVTTTENTMFGKVTPKTFPERWATPRLSKKDYDEHLPETMKTPEVSKKEYDADEGSCDHLEKRGAP